MEFKLEEFPKSIDQLAQIGLVFLNLDSRVEWGYNIEVNGWDAKIIYNQGKFKWIIGYGAGGSILYFFTNVASGFAEWRMSKQREAWKELSV